jgi:hypothetical protein
MGEGMIQHRREAMNPLMGVRLGHPTELSVDLWDGVLCHVGQAEAPCGRSRRSRPVVIRPVTSAGAGLPIDGAVLHIGHQRPLDMRQQRRACFLSEPRHSL